MRLPDDVEIGVFGGTGLYALLDRAVEYRVETPYGPPSDAVTVGELAGRKVAFLPRHGRQHTIPPHAIPYLANIFAFRKLGVSRVIAPSACGSLQPDIHPGSFVVSDQFVDRTRGRRDTFYDGPVVTHVSTAEPYCPELRALACDVIAGLGIPLHREGTCVVVQGPRFSTKAESRFFTSCGWHTVNMTQYPEVALAREMEMCYVNISLVTDYDAGVVATDGAGHAVTTDVMAVLQQNSRNVRDVIREMIARMPPERSCGCGSVLETSRIE